MKPTKTDENIIRLADIPEREWRKVLTKFSRQAVKHLLDEFPRFRLFAFAVTSDYLSQGFFRIELPDPVPGRKLNLTIYKFLPSHILIEFAIPEAGGYTFSRDVSLEDQLDILIREIHRFLEEEHVMYQIQYVSGFLPGKIELRELETKLTTWQKEPPKTTKGQMPVSASFYSWRGTHDCKIRWEKDSLTDAASAITNNSIGEIK